jgi:hypothetical protein
MPAIIVLLILLAAALYILPPLLRGDPPRLGASRKSVAWEALADAASRRDAAYEALTDLELDYLSGKISQDDFARLKRQYQKIAVAALKDLDGLSQGSAALTAATGERGAS